MLLLWEVLLQYGLNITKFIILFYYFAIMDTHNLSISVCAQVTFFIIEWRGVLRSLFNRGGAYYPAIFLSGLQ